MGTVPSLSQNLLRSVTYKSYYAGEREKNIREELDTASPVVTFVTVAGFVCFLFLTGFGEGGRRTENEHPISSLKD